ncbi:hypothetical protein DNK48_10610 [Streptomyces malaysiensis subsp. malaysiensis]|uniref:hypothetical protein n=1 Tax=Streptomyces malaysiensis TaxID=92644 RepID=UPI000BFCFE66|nr:hypothetical protein [Streptomyces malaysiensis]ATL86678.1 hypothetical protein SMALA_6450 [Streptomyces malaysiensis]QDL69786.1 hypothetical protein DNK48_10610 [Streptomyces malaysiensis]
MSDKTKRAIRTAIQTLLAIAAVLPALAAVIADNDALAVAAPWLVAAVGSAAAAAGIVAHIMATPPYGRSRPCGGAFVITGALLAL